MTLIFNLITARDLLAKLGRDAQALDDEVTVDRLFNFVVTGYSMIDWIKNDPSVPQSAKDSVNDLYGDKWLKICGDVATAAKHFEVTKRPTITVDFLSSHGFGIGRYGKGGFGSGEPSIEMLLDDGTSYDCLDLANGVLNSWHEFFRVHGL